MEDEEMEKKVQQYLHRKGFRLTELALQEERNRLSTTSLSDVSLSRYPQIPPESAPPQLPRLVAAPALAPGSRAKKPRGSDWLPYG